MKFYNTILIYLLFILLSLCHGEYRISGFGKPKYEKSFKHFNYVNPNAPQKGKLTLAVIGSFDTLNPFNLIGVPAEGASLLIYDSLLFMSEDELAGAYSLLADNIVIKDNSLIIYLNNNAKWHDGKPITSQDIAFTFNKLKAEGRPYYQSIFKMMRKTEILTNNVIKVDFATIPDDDLIISLGTVPILPKHYWKNKNFAKPTFNIPLGSGPYKITTVKNNKYIEYTKVKNYWGKKLPVRIGYFNFNKIVYRYFSSSHNARHAMQKQEIDIYQENIAKEWEKFWTADVLQKHLKKKNFRIKNSGNLQSYVFNVRKDIFKDIRIRKAIFYASDIAWVNRYMLFSQYKPAHGIFDNTMFSSYGYPSSSELALMQKYKDNIPNDVFKNKNPNNHTQNLKETRQNLLLADQLLQNAGWIVEEGKRINKKTGQKLTFELLLISKNLARISYPFLKNLELLGIEMQIKIVDRSQYYNLIKNFDFDMAINTWFSSAVPNIEQIAYWGSASATQTGSKNLSGVQDKGIDLVLQNLAITGNFQDKITSAQVLERLIKHKFILIPHIYSYGQKIIYNNRVQFPQLATLFGTNFMLWWAK